MRDSPETVLFIKPDGIVPVHYLDLKPADAAGLQSIKRPRKQGFAVSVSTVFLQDNQIID